MEERTISIISKNILAYQATCPQEETDKQQILNYIDHYPDVLTRQNTTCHFTSSSLILNKKRDKTLFIFHNIYQSWSWTGGHVDGETDFLGVALREAQEETGLKNFRVVSPEIACLDVLPVVGHFKHNKWVSAHLHLSVAYLFEADEQEPLHVNQLETSGCRWIPLSDLAQFVREKDMLPIYQKLITRSRLFI